MSSDFVFTSESVTEGHPDKLCDQISDAIVDRYLALDPGARTVAECAVARGVAFIAARFASSAKVDIPALARQRTNARFSSVMPSAWRIRSVFTWTLSAPAGWMRLNWPDGLRPASIFASAVLSAFFSYANYPAKALSISAWPLMGRWGEQIWNCPGKIPIRRRHYVNWR